MDFKSPVSLKRSNHDRLVNRPRPPLHAFCRLVGGKIWNSKSEPRAYLYRLSSIAALVIIRRPSNRPLWPRFPRIKKPLDGDFYLRLFTLRPFFSDFHPARRQTKDTLESEREQVLRDSLALKVTRVAGGSGKNGRPLTAERETTPKQRPINPVFTRVTNKRRPRSVREQKALSFSRSWKHVTSELRKKSRNVRKRRLQGQRRYSHFFAGLDRNRSSYGCLRLGSAVQPWRESRGALTDR